MLQEAVDERFGREGTQFGFPRVRRPIAKGNLVVLQFDQTAVADGKVYFGSFDKNVYALNASAGALVWSYATGDWVVSSPAVANGMVYVGSFNHQFYAFGSSSSEQTYSVSFTASGLPSGTRWNVTFNGQIQSSTSDSIVFNVPNGVYAFTITPPNGYEASPSSGSITVHFADTHQQVTFTSTVSDGLSLVGLAIALAIILAVVLLAIVVYVRKR